MDTTLAPFDTTFHNTSYFADNTAIGDNRTYTRSWSSSAFDIVTTLTVIGVAGVLSNIAVLAVLFKKDNRKLATNRYLVNLAISDILMSCFISILVAQRVYHIAWTPNSCRLYIVVRYIPLYLGINTIMLIAVERFVAIILPTHFRTFVASRMVTLQLALTWLLTASELIVPMMVVKVTHFGRFVHCATHLRRVNVYYVFLSSVGLPSVFLVVAYGTIVAVVVYRLHNSHSSVVPTPSVGGAAVASTLQQVQAARRQRRSLRVAVTCAVVTLMFLVCWLPVWIIALMLSYEVGSVTVDMILWTNMLNYVHSFINPIIYFTADDRFRSVLLRIVCRKQATADITEATVGTTAN